MTEENEKWVATFYQALGCPTRIAIIRHLLHTNEARILDLQGKMEHAQPTLSYHLRILFCAKIVESRQRGLHHYWALRDPRLVARLLSMVPPC